MPKCPIPWCGADLPDDRSMTHPKHDEWAKEIEQGRVVFLAVRNPDGTIDVSRWVR